jgi:hypothetical protein
MCDLLSCAELLSAQNCLRTTKIADSIEHLPGAALPVESTERSQNIPTFRMHRPTSQYCGLVKEQQLRLHQHGCLSRFLTRVPSSAAARRGNLTHVAEAVREQKGPAQFANMDEARDYLMLESKGGLIAGALNWLSNAAFGAGRAGAHIGSWYRHFLSQDAEGHR